MRIFFDSKIQSYFPVWKLTLVPGENVIPDKIGNVLIEAHEADCKASGDKPRLRKLADAPKVKPEPKPLPDKPFSSTRVDKDKKGVK